jgi:hypothetical protein
MTERTTGYASIPKVLVAGLGDRYAGAYVATRFPSAADPNGDVQTITGAGGSVIRVMSLGGDRDRINARQRVAVDVIARDEAAAEDLAEDICTWLLDTRPIRVPGQQLLDAAECEIAPHELPYADPTISQFSATYVVSTRRIEAR